MATPEKPKPETPAAPKFEMPKARPVEKPPKKRVAFLASRNGSTMRAVVQAARRGYIDIQPVLLISNRAECGAMKWAAENKIPVAHISKKTAGNEALVDAAIAKKLAEVKPDYILLTGYMHKIGKRVLESYKKRILNAHPALLPKFGGQGMYGEHVHKAVVAAKETKSGATIHLVDDVYDHGPIVAQVEVPVSFEDDHETLGQRVQSEERLLFIETMRKILAGEIDLDKL